MSIGHRKQFSCALMMSIVGHMEARVLQYLYLLFIFYTDATNMILLKKNFGEI